jgi:hypothetical protein
LKTIFVAASFNDGAPLGVFVFDHSITINSKTSGDYQQERYRDVTIWSRAEAFPERGDFWYVDSSARLVVGTLRLVKSAIDREKGSETASVVATMKTWTGQVPRGQINWLVVSNLSSLTKEAKGKGELSLIPNLQTQLDETEGVIATLSTTEDSGVCCSIMQFCRNEQGAKECKVYWTDGLDVIKAKLKKEGENRSPEDQIQMKAVLRILDGVEIKQKGEYVSGTATIPQSMIRQFVKSYFLEPENVLPERPRSPRPFPQPSFGPLDKK